jgi:hypothetical protein
MSADRSSSRTATAHRAVGAPARTLTPNERFVTRPANMQKSLSRFTSITFTLCALLALGCSKADGDAGAQQKAPGIGDTCKADGPACKQGSCITDPVIAGTSGGICTSTCDSHDDCLGTVDGESMRCATTANGTRYCAAVCANQQWDYDGTAYVCVDGARASCEANPCPEGAECVPGEGCKAPLGGECADDHDCKSTHCRESGTCGVRIGEECTADDCDDCRSVDGIPGKTFCFADCNYSDDCPADTSICLSYTAQDKFYCHMKCTADCPNCNEEVQTDYDTGEVIQYSWCDVGLTPLQDGMGGAGGSN